MPNTLPGAPVLPGIGAPILSLVPLRLPEPDKVEPAMKPAELHEFALTSAAMGFHQSALDAIKALIDQVPDHAPFWRDFAAWLRLAGRDDEAARADRAAETAAQTGLPWPQYQDFRPPAKIAEAERMLRGRMRKLPKAEALALARDRLFERPTDVAAMRVLAAAERLDGDKVTSMRLLERALLLAPGYVGARADLAELLQDRRLHVQAVAHTTRLMQDAPGDAFYRALHADALTNVDQFEAALELRTAQKQRDPRNPKVWLSYAKALHFVRRNEDSVAAYRTCLELAPTMGEAYWGLAGLKAKYITEADIAAIGAQLAGNRIDDSARMHMLYARGQYREQAKDYAGAFADYEQAARLFGALAAAQERRHDPEAWSERLRRHRAVFTAANIVARTDTAGAVTPTPIFIVGMPRAGSTLVEQILASHSQVEGTRELPVITDITRDLALSRVMVKQDAYPECALDLTPAQRADLGARYLRDAEIYRHTTRPCFVDKRPWNWCDAGLIQFILPHAKIIDVRRAPMAACFGMFKQLLPFDVAFSADLEHLGRYYCEYVDMMRHWDKVMPGRIHYVSYERLVLDTEAEIRRMLDYCGLPFEESCLNYWQTDRAVATPSAEQVRRPIYRDALEQWRNFEPWLGKLSDALARHTVK